MEAWRMGLVRIDRSLDGTAPLTRVGSLMEARAISARYPGACSALEACNVPNALHAPG
jgi:hypothetical protein